MAKHVESRRAVSKGAASTSNIGADLVTAIARNAGAGQGKDKVSVGAAVPLGDLETQAKAEMAAIAAQSNAFQTRAECWRKVGDMAAAHFKLDGKGRAVNDVLSLYPDLVRAECLINIGLPADLTNKNKKAWPAEIQAIYDRVIGKRISETRQMMHGFLLHFDESRKVLSGKGTIYQKLAALPKPEGSKRGKPKGTQQQPQTGDGQINSWKTEIGARLKGLDFHQLGEVADLIVAHAKQRKEYKEPLAHNFVEALATARATYLAKAAQQS